MQSWAQVFLVIATIMAVMVVGGFAGSAVGIAKVLFAICLVLSITSAIRSRRQTV